MCFTDSENERLAVNPQAEEGITKTPSPYIMKTETSVTSNYYKHDRELSSLLTELPSSSPWRGVRKLEYENNSSYTYLTNVSRFLLKLWIVLNYVFAEESGTHAGERLE